MAEDQDHLVLIVPKNRREAVHVSLRRYKGRDIVDLRVFFRNDEGTMLATGKGVAIAVEKLPALIEALNRAAGEAADLGLLDEKDQDGEVALQH